ncbi:MAG: diaminopimelate decarboxylase [Acidobacteriota bacterium]
MPTDTVPADTVPTNTVPTDTAAASPETRARNRDGRFQLDGFRYVDGQLFVEDVAVEAIADAVGTPVYLYSQAAITRAFERMRQAFALLRARLHYAVKSSPNLHLCRLVRELGGRMDVVSIGELERAWLAGVPMADIVFAGVAKTEDEVLAALDGRYSPMAGRAEAFGRGDLEGRGPVGLFNVESAAELERIARLAERIGVPAKACLRVNPDVDAKTHEYTTTGLEENKFGIYADQIPELFDAYRGHPAIQLVGLQVHIGSPVREVQPYVETVKVLVGLLERLEAAGHQPSVLDLGGGWGVDYRERESSTPEDYAAQIVPLLVERANAGLEILLEPGRSIVGNAGVMIARVQYLKQGRQKRFVICDAGMHTLIRPALYRAFHFLWPVRPPAQHLDPARVERPDLPGLVECDVVGPICETGDFLARSRPLPEMAQGDLLAVFSAGAYGVSMASNYNDHGRPAEVLVNGAEARVIAERQQLADLLETERKPRVLELAAVDAGSA